MISPLLANIYLHTLDRWWSDRHGRVGQLYRYCDDFVVVCPSRAAAEQARGLIAGFLERLKLTLHPGKTDVVDLGCGGFDFLGFHYHTRPIAADRTPGPVRVAQSVGEAEGPCDNPTAHGADPLAGAAC